MIADLHLHPYHEAELGELADDNDLVLWFEDTGDERGFAVWCIAQDAGEEDIIGSGSDPGEAIEAARVQIRAWEARNGTR